MLLKELIIKNFRGISEKQVMDFAASNKAKESLANNFLFKKNGQLLLPLVIGFIGKNASGKTTIIEAIKFIVDLSFHLNAIFNDFYKNHIISRSGIEDLESSSRESNDSKSIINARNNKLINEFVQLSLDNKRNLFPKEYKMFIETLFERDSCDKRNPVEMELVFANGKDTSKINISLSKTELKTNFYSNNKKISNVKDKKHRKIWLSMLSFQNPYLESKLILKKQWQLIEIIGIDKYNQILRMVDKNIEKIDFIIDDSKRVSFNKIWMKNDALLPFSFLSSGTIRFLKFITKMIISNRMLKNEPIIYFADEIGNHLHAKLIHFIFNLVGQKLSNCQLIFTTHSPSIVEKLSRHSIWVIQNEDQTRIRKVSSIIRNQNSFYKKFISEEISSHPSSMEINEVLYELANGE